MSSILNRVQLFLTEANKASVPISSTIINEFGEACKDAFIKQFVEERETKFKPRMSAIGRPLCQLQMEKSGAEAETPPYNSKMRFIFGDLIEALAVAILKSSGVKIDDFQKKVKYVFGDDEINGTYDVKIMDKIWDIKSASPYAFQYKFGESGGFDALLKDEVLGKKDTTFFISHDIYEEWALEKFIGISFENRASTTEFFTSLGHSLAIRRSFRLWISEQLFINEKEIKVFIENAIDDGEIQPIWKDEIITGILLSDYSTTFFDNFESAIDPLGLVRSSWSQLD